MCMLHVSQSHLTGHWSDRVGLSDIMVFGVFFRSLEHRFKHEKEDSIWESK